MEEKFCPTCGAAIHKNAEICPKCGVRQPRPTCSGSYDVNVKWIISLILCIFLGTIGVHRFFNGKVGTGILMIFTLGGCGVWTLIDLIMIATGTFTDIQGNTIKFWNE